MSSENGQVKKIVVDSGKYGTKAIGRAEDGEKKRVYFQTKMDPTNETITSADESFVIQFEGERFLIGKNATLNDSDTSKSKELHRNAIYTAIHQLVNDKDEVSLVVGCPISIYTEKENREEYEEFLSENETVDFTVNEVRKSFKVVNVNTLPESSGYVFKHMDKFIGKMVAVVDIGGLNANCCIYEGVDMLPDTDFTYNLGTNVLRSGLKKTLNKKFQSNLSDKQTEEAMKERQIRINPEKSKAVINDFFLGHIKKLMEAMKENQWDIHNLEFVFVGGGSLVLAQEIQAIFGDEVTISEDAVWDNAEGFGELIDL